MRKSNIINEIIEMQSKNPEVFIQVAKKEDLEKLSKAELTIVYNVTFVACNY